MESAGDRHQRLLSLYRTMTLIRQVEQALIKLFADGEVPGFIHL
ncbi:MAG: ABC transporter substrate-binding protein, partial [Rhodoferax sp.]